MKRSNIKSKKLAVRTVRFSVISSVILGLACLIVGLHMHRNMLLDTSIRANRTTAAKAAMVAQKSEDTAGLAGDVMGVYNSLTPEQRSLTGTEEYRQYFQSLPSASNPEGTSAILSYKLRNYSQDVSGVYVCALDAERNALICLSDSDEENPMHPGDWFEITAEQTEKIANEKNGDWSGKNTMYYFRDTGEKGTVCIAVFPVADERKEKNDPDRIVAYLITEISLNNVLDQGIQYILQVSIVILVVTLAAAFIVGMRMRRTVANPIVAITGAAKAYVQDRKNGVARSDHFSSLGIKTRDELENLTDTMADMEQELIEHENQITKITAEKERINAELNMAGRIQTGALPSVFPDRPEFDLFASMTPAREVGGDFYDFFLVDDDHLAVVIADVSGKGIPAALFMMVAKALIRNQLLSGCDPARALEGANYQLCEGNTSMTFVTVWLAVLELSTGRGLACNAGHESPALYRSGSQFELLEYKHDRIVGVFRNSQYHVRKFRMNPGDCLFVYTDGVPEANNAASQMFGENELIETLNQDADAMPEELIRRVQKAVDSFADNAPQFDDITMLCLKYYGGSDLTE